MITKVTSSTLYSRCPSCATDRELSLDDLTAGTPTPVLGSTGDRDMIVLPSCLGCGATIAYCRTFDNPSTAAHAANTLHAALVRMERTEPTCDLHNACGPECDPTAGRSCPCCQPISVQLDLSKPSEYKQSVVIVDFDKRLDEALSFIYKAHTDRSLPLPGWFLAAGHALSLKERGLI